jgi:PIN like domain
VSPRERRPDTPRHGTGRPDGDERPVEFFIDRSLGRKHLAQALRELGLTAHTMASVYGERTAQQLDDRQWLTDAGRHGWVVLMKDDAIRRRPAERDALSEAKVRAFCLTNAQLRASEQSARFVGNMARILRQSQKPGPYIYGVYNGHIRRLWPQGQDVHESR